MSFLVPLALGLAAGGGGGSSSTSQANSTNTIAFNPSINIGGSIEGQRALGETGVRANSVSDNTPSSPLNSSAIYEDQGLEALQTTSNYTSSGLPTWLIWAGLGVAAVGSYVYLKPDGVS